MKIKNVSATGAYAFKAKGKLLLVPPGVVVDVPADQQAAVQRLLNKYDEAPSTAVFAMAGANEKAVTIDENETHDEQQTRERVLSERAADADRLAKHEEAIKREAAEKNRQARGGDPSDMLRDAHGKPIKAK